MDVVFYPHTSNLPILLQYILVNILTKFLILQERIDNELAKVNLAWHISQQSFPLAYMLTPGSMVITLPAGSLPRTLRYLNIVSLSS